LTLEWAWDLLKLLLCRFVIVIVRGGVVYHLVIYVENATLLDLI
jgi:hypothetical protein